MIFENESRELLVKKYKQREEMYKLEIEKRKEEFEENSKDFKIIELWKGKTDDSDAYYENKDVFITFCLDRTFHEHLKKWPIFARQGSAVFDKHFEEYLEVKNGVRIAQTFEDYLPTILDFGRATVFSKVENRFVKEIKKGPWGMFAGPLAAVSGFGYYLPDGTCFHKVQTHIS